MAARVGRNSLSARSGEKQPAKPQQPPTLEATQINAIAKSVNEISKEVCPTSTFTVRRKVPIDGVEMELRIVPGSLAGDMARQNPAFLGNKLKVCWQAGDVTTVREMLVPVEPMQEASSPPKPTPIPTPTPLAGVTLPPGGASEASSSEADPGDVRMAVPGLFD